jgi:hypothetical protein
MMHCYAFSTICKACTTVTLHVTWGGGGGLNHKCNSSGVLILKLMLNSSNFCPSWLGTGEGGSILAIHFNSSDHLLFSFCRSEDLGWKCITEQVMHHPPMVAQFCESATGDEIPSPPPPVGVYLVQVSQPLIGQQGLGDFFRFRPLFPIGWRIVQILRQCLRKTTNTANYGILSMTK